MIKPWDKIDSQYLGDFRIFRIRQDTSRSPRTGQLHRFFVLESPDWVNVIPLTPAGNVIMIRQYRHGTEDVTLEVPGGMVDTADADPSVSALRELQEETGYAADRIVHLGSVAPNPAFLNNRCHSYLALDVQLAGEVSFDGAEDIAFEEVPLVAIPDLIRAGAITHSLTITAFHYLGLSEEGKRLTQRTLREQRPQKDETFATSTQVEQETQSRAGASKSGMEAPENVIAKHIVDVAYHIHKQLGPGLLEAAYESVLAYELEGRGLKVQRQLVLPMNYGALHVDSAYRLDLLVEDTVIVELKSVEGMNPVHQKQLLTYLKLADKRLGLLLNFGMETMKQGIKRVVNGLPS